MKSRTNLLMLLPLFLMIAMAGALNSTPSYNNTYNVAINLSAEISNSNAAGFSLAQGSLASQSASGCIRVLITSCNNNVPDQFICINNSYYGAYESQNQNISMERGQQACPMFLLEGSVSCGVVSGYCVVTYSGSASPLNPTTTVNGTAISLPASNSTITQYVESALSSILGKIISFFKNTLHLN